ncbi:hypothetical protein DYB32_005443 [Aphanomyces invadans]|uniref:Fibronectin type-III domain-containing protein n=1 Tax=Aphanomyces invadans TaxID=157072 RepID=A0A3R7CZN1_9STRA|nr:hypothetical protein DYB32_005443 [Aphanomyces invadans]
MLPTAAPTTVKATTTTPVPTLNVNETHGVPGNPTDVVAVASDAQAQVSWKAPEDDGEDPITEYEVVCYVVDTNTPLPLAIQVTASGEQGSQVPTNALVPNLQNGVTYAFKIEMFYDDVVFSAESERAFTVAFATEVASALQLPPSRLDVVSLRRGSIHVQMYLLPPTQAGEKSLNEVVADLQSQVNDKTSVLRTQGTFCRRVYPSGVKMSFFIAEQHGAAEAEDISIGGLVGTIAVSVGFVAAFAYCLRKRHERLMKFKASKRMGSDSKMKPMGIRTMS